MVRPEPLAPTRSGSLSISQVRYIAERPAGQQSDFSQPVTAPELYGGDKSREGYTSRSFDRPVVPFSLQKYYMERDEDVQLAINHLASQITGGAHYWKSEIPDVQIAMTKFSKAIDFDWLDTITVKETLGYGNSVLKPRLGIKHIRGREDIMILPISSFVRVWWDRQRRPYRYEFRGAEYMGYHDPSDIIHLTWNPVNGSVFGTGFLTALCATRDFTEVTPTGEVEKRLPSLLDRKYSTMMTMHITERRYIPHNVYQAITSSQAERDALASQLADLRQGEDFVVGSKVEVTELGSMQRAFNPTQFTELTQGAIFKALNDFRGKQAQESSHQFANAKTSAILDEIGLASFPLAITMQLIEQLFQPWYIANGGVYSAQYGGGLIAVPWDESNIELHFGRVQKKDLPPEQLIQLLQLGIQSGAIQDPLETRALLEDAGLGLRKEFTQSLEATYHNTEVMPPYMEQPNFDTSSMDLAPRPMDAPQYYQSYVPPNPWQSMDASFDQSNAYNPQPSKIGFIEPNAGQGGISKKRLAKIAGGKLDIDDLNAFLAAADSGNNG